MLAPLLRAIRRRAHAPPVLIGITGAVAVGKSTIAADIAERLSPLSVAIVGTDGFLKPNARLLAEGIFDRKGFPESHDLNRLRAFLAAVRRRETVDAPVYSHTVYDVVEGASQTVGHIDVLILEGVVALEETVAPLLDMGVFVDAPLADVERWYHERRARLYGSAPEIRARGERLWATVNRPNYERFIAPSRRSAEWIVSKAADHTIVEVSRCER